MFSGIVEEQAVVEEILNQGTVKLRIRSSLNHAYTKIGDSICINGVCLTAVKIDNGLIDFDLSAETLQRTNLGNLNKGSKINLERSLIVGERIHGHFVFGHVDATSKILSIKDLGDCRDITFEIPDGMEKYIVEKGSVSINGTSLTVSAVDKNKFSVSLIPHTLSATTLGAAKNGDEVNLEADMLARYALKEAV